MQVHSLGYRTDLMVRQLAGSAIEDAGDCLVVRTPDNPTYYWGNFLLLPHLPEPGDLARWLDRFGRTFPSAGHVALGIDGTGPWPADRSDWEQFGLAADTGAVLTATTLHPPARPPADAHARPLRSDQDWRQAVDFRISVASSDGTTFPGHPSFLAATVAEARRLSDAGHATFWGAFVDRRLCAYLGLVDGGGPVARFQTVETHPAFRRRGLAGELVYRAGLHGREGRGARTLVMVADPGGPAIGLYRRLGFTDRESQVELLRTPAP